MYDMKKMGVKFELKLDKLIIDDMDFVWLCSGNNKLMLGWFYKGDLIMPHHFSKKKNFLKAIKTLDDSD